MNIAILTSVETRHRYFARVLCDRLNVVAIGYEQTGYAPAETPLDDLTPEERSIFERHFAERTRQEEIFFGAVAGSIEPSDRCAVRSIEPGKLNSNGTLTFLEQSGADTIVVFGTNLIKSPLLQRFAGRIVNMHLGLSPYYRGTATNFYPLLNGEPEYVGATIHLVDAGIDSGPILRHARPTIVADDMPHTIGCKAILAGIDAFCLAIVEWDAGRLEPVPQWKPAHPRVCLRKDYHPRQVIELYRKLGDGLIREYLERAERGIEIGRLIG
jgi:methionyl-tRNA formyltransferase